MNNDRIDFFASVIVLGTGVFWGFYWLPVRALADLGLAGAWGTLAITSATVLVLSPLAVRRYASLRQAEPVVLVSIALGGAAFALYSVGFVHGRVAIVILLYFLTPVWSTLIGQFVMAWQTTRLRMAAIGVGLLGLVVMLSAEGDLPLPHSSGEWMALLAGLLWSISTIGIRARSTLAPFESAFVFAGGAALASFVMAPFLVNIPQDIGAVGLISAAGISIVAGGVWWGLSVSSLLWATRRLDPTRVGILLMAEVIVGAVSAAVFAGERLLPLEIAGGALVLSAGFLELWPSRSVARQDGRRA